MTDPAPHSANFDRRIAFSRNLGLLTLEEAELLAQSTVAIAGLGGVGGAHLEVLARQGIGGFTLADPDTFEQANLNRQFGAVVSTLGESKTAVCSRRALDINPSARVTVLPEGVTEKNVDSFLSGANIVIDALDAFLIAPRRLLYRAARAKNIPVLAAGPLGFGATMLVFMPSGLSFDDYYGIAEGMPWEEQFARFILGTSPKALHVGYLDMSYVNLKEHRGPSSSVGVTLCAAAVGMETLRLLLGWDGVRPVPCYAQIDLRNRVWAQKRLWGGNRHPLQKIKIAIFQKRLKTLLTSPPKETA